MPEEQPQRDTPPAAALPETLSSAEREVLALLWMSPETREMLATMLVPEDERELRGRGGSVEGGVALCLDKLATLGLVSFSTETTPERTEVVFWWLTQHGRTLTRTIVNDEQ